MGCEVVLEGASAGEFERVQALFEERDAVFSRFRPDSELNRVNAAGGATLVSPQFARMVEVALWARETTGGLVDLTLGDALEAAGYDRDFDELEARHEPAAAARPGSVSLFGRGARARPRDEARPERRGQGCGGGRRAGPALGLGVRLGRG